MIVTITENTFSIIELIFSINTLFEAFILFPKTEISKYSNFRIEPISADGIVIEDPNKLLNIFNR